MPPDRHGRRRRHQRDVKDRLVQTRVPERLETVLKEEAQKRRLTVSHLIRNMLEDTLQLVDTVVAGAGEIALGSVDLAEQVKRDAEKIASTAREAVRSRSNPAKTPSGEPKAQRGAPSGAAPVPKTAEPPVPPPAPPAVVAVPDPNKLAALDHVLGWNQLVVNRPARCSSCEKELPRGVSAHLGVSSNPAAPPTWICENCLERL
jgi:hypothetical protein